jgi:hypothetical protein
VMNTTEIARIISEVARTGRQASVNGTPVTVEQIINATSRHDWQGMYQELHLSAAVRLARILEPARVVVDHPTTRELAAVRVKSGVFEVVVPNSGVSEMVA